jgi:hypothetical protein
MAARLERGGRARHRDEAPDPVFLLNDSEPICQKTLDATSPTPRG